MNLWSTPHVCIMVADLAVANHLRYPANMSSGFSNIPAENTTCLTCLSSMRVPKKIHYKNTSDSSARPQTAKDLFVHAVVQPIQLVRRTRMTVASHIAGIHRGASADVDEFLTPGHPNSY